MNFSVNKG